MISKLSESDPRVELYLCKSDIKMLTAVNKPCYPPVFASCSELAAIMSIKVNIWTFIIRDKLFEMSVIKKLF